MAGGFCERANRRGMVGDGYVSAAHPLFVAAADRLRHAERALSHHAQPPSTDATSTPPRLCCRPRRSRCRPRSGASHTHSAHVCQHRCLGHHTRLRGAGRCGDAARGVQNFYSLAENDTLVDAETLAEGDWWL